MMSPDERYFRDPQFKHLVDFMIDAIRHAQFTPTEIREAAMLAAIKYDQLRPGHHMEISLEEGTRIIQAARRQMNMEREL